MQKPVEAVTPKKPVVKPKVVQPKKRVVLRRTKDPLDIDMNELKREAKKTDELLKSLRRKL